MKHKLLFGLVALAFAFVSCNGDEIDALKKRIKTLESITGAAEPISFNYSTTDYDNDAVTKNTTFRFKGSDYETSSMSYYGGDEYGVYVQRFSNINADESASFFFIYDTETGEVTNVEVGLDFRNSDNNNINPYFSSGNTENTITVTVKSFNVETGVIDVAFHITTTEEFGNPYEGRAQTLDLSFRGKLSHYEANL